MTKYMPHYDIQEVLRKKSEKLRKKCNVYSMWYYEAETKTITICTTNPGYWIGYMGKGIEDLLDEIKAIVKSNHDILLKATEEGRLSPNPILCDEVEKINFIDCSN